MGKAWYDAIAWCMQTGAQASAIVQHMQASSLEQSCNTQPFTNACQQPFEEARTAYMQQMLHDSCIACLLNISLHVLVCVCVSGYLK